MSRSRQQLTALSVVAAMLVITLPLPTTAADGEIIICGFIKNRVGWALPATLFLKLDQAAGDSGVTIPVSSNGYFQWTVQVGTESNAFSLVAEALQSQTNGIVETSPDGATYNAWSSDVDAPAPIRPSEIAVPANARLCGSQPGYQLPDMPPKDGSGKVSSFVEDGNIILTAPGQGFVEATLRDFAINATPPMQGLIRTPAVSTRSDGQRVFWTMSDASTGIARVACVPTDGSKTVLELEGPSEAKPYLRTAWEVTCDPSATTAATTTVPMWRTPVKLSFLVTNASFVCTPTLGPFVLGCLKPQALVKDPPGTCSGAAFHQYVCQSAYYTVNHTEQPVSDALVGVARYPAGVRLDLCRPQLIDTEVEGVRVYYDVRDAPKTNLAAGAAESPYTCSRRTDAEGIATLLVPWSDSGAYRFAIDASLEIPGLEDEPLFEARYAPATRDLRLPGTTVQPAGVKNPLQDTERDYGPIGGSPADLRVRVPLVPKKNEVGAYDLTLTRTVTLGSGAPVADASLTFIGSSKVWAKTDASGSFTVRLVAGRYNVTVSGPEQNTRECVLDIAASGAITDVAKPESPTTCFLLTPFGKASLSGTARDALTGLPIKNIPICVGSCSPSPAALTNGLGQFNLEIDAGARFTLGTGTPWQEIAPDAAVELGETFVLDQALPRVKHNIDVTVIDANTSTNAGAGVVVCVAGVVQGKDCSPADSSTDAAGLVKVEDVFWMRLATAHQIHLPTGASLTAFDVGPAHIEATRHTSNPHIWDRLAFNLTSDAPADAPLTIHAKQEFTRATSIAAEDANSNATLAGATITITTVDGASCGADCTSGSTPQTYPLYGNHSYNVCVDKAGYFPCATVEIAPGSSAKPRLFRTTTPVTLTLVDAHTNATIVGATVVARAPTLGGTACRPADVPESRSPSYVCSASTATNAAQGLYSFSSPTVPGSGVPWTTAGEICFLVPTGKYFAVGASAGPSGREAAIYQAGSTCPAIPSTLPIGQTSFAVELRVSRVADVPITGRVVDASSGLPIAGAYVNATNQRPLTDCDPSLTTSASRFPTCRFVTGVDGTFSLLLPRIGNLSTPNGADSSTPAADWAWDLTVTADDHSPAVVQRATGNVGDVVLVPSFTARVTLLEGEVTKQGACPPSGTALKVTLTDIRTPNLKYAGAATSTGTACTITVSGIGLPTTGNTRLGVFLVEAEVAERKGTSVGVFGQGREEGAFRFYSAAASSEGVGITGKVVDAVTGKGVSGVLITAVRNPGNNACTPGANPNLRSVTNVDGSFSIPQPAKCAYTVFANHSTTPALSCYSDAAPLTTSREQRSGYVIQLPPGPAAETCRALSLGTLSGEGFGPAAQGVDVPDASDRIIVNVQDSDAFMADAFMAPVGGATITAVKQGGACSGGATGGTSIEVAPGVYAIEAPCRGTYALALAHIHDAGTRWYNLTDRTQNVDVASSVTTAVFTLDRTMGTLDVTLDSLTDEPVPSSSVTATGTNVTYQPSARTGPSGRATIPVLWGEYLVTASPDLGTALATVVYVPPGGTAETAVPHYANKSYIRGKVVDRDAGILGNRVDQSSNGVRATFGVTAANVVATRVGGPCPNGRGTFESGGTVLGEYVVPVDCTGTFDLNVVHVLDAQPNRQYDDTARTRTGVLVGFAPTTADFVLNRTRSVLTIHVQRDDGTPVPGATVRLQPVDTAPSPPPAPGGTNATGDVEWTLPWGTYAYAVVAAPELGLPGFVQLPPNAPHKANARVVLVDTPFAKIAGRVTDADWRKAVGDDLGFPVPVLQTPGIPDVIVEAVLTQATPPDPVCNGLVGRSFFAVTNATGDYRLNVPCLGRYSVKATHPSDLTVPTKLYVPMGTTVPVVVEAVGQVVPCDMSLARQSNGFLRVRVFSLKNDTKDFTSPKTYDRYSITPIGVDVAASGSLSRTTPTDTNATWDKLKWGLYEMRFTENGISITQYAYVFPTWAGQRQTPAIGPLAPQDNPAVNNRQAPLWRLVGL